MLKFFDNIKKEIKKAFEKIICILFEQMFGIFIKKIKKLFKELKFNSPCILFIDEIDAIGKKEEILKINTNKL